MTNRGAPCQNWRGFPCQMYGGTASTMHLEMSHSTANREEAPEVTQDEPLMKKEFIGPRLHLRPVHADHTRPPLQWTLNSVFSIYGNDSRRIRPPTDRGILKIYPGYSSPKRTHTLITPSSRQAINFSVPIGV